MIDAAQTGRRMMLEPSTARVELEKLQHAIPAIIDAISTMDVGCSFIAAALRHLGREAACPPSAK